MASPCLQSIKLRISNKLIPIMFPTTILSSVLLLASIAVCDLQVTLRKNEVITGALEGGTVEVFKGIPYADPPTGDFRFKKPRDYSGSYNGLQAQHFKAACMQWNPVHAITIVKDALDIGKIGLPDFILNSPLFDVAQGSINMDEDCLFLNVFRPAGTKPTDKLPVMVWYYGGAFVLGSAASYPGNRYIDHSVDMKQPVIFVSLGFRSGPYGFLGGDATKAEGNTNAGLHDQRKALEWVQDNIGRFGGDPGKVLIFGESSGAMSVAHQMVAYGGNNTYKGNKLFHSAILQSGGPLPYLNSQSTNPTKSYNEFLNAAGCSGLSSAEALKCLRGKTQDELADAQNSYSVNELFGIMPEFLGFGPRPDGDIIPGESFDLFRSGKFAQVPFITGNMMDEGTIFAPVAIDAGTQDELRAFLKENIFTQASDDTLNNVLGQYGPEQYKGAPFEPDPVLEAAWEVVELFNFLTDKFRSFRQIAAIFTDVLYHSPRRTMLESSNQRRWTYLSKKFHEFPVVGAFHASDIIYQYWLDGNLAYLRYFIAFANNHDPNVGSTLENWPEWDPENRANLIIENDNTPGTDIFRDASISYFQHNRELFGK